jgi:glycosyltransferase involved in cell wall biosynthesis
MKVTVIGPSYPLRGGIAHHVYCLTRALAARGHTVQLISFLRLYPNLLFPGKTELDSSVSKLDAGGERILNPLNPFTWRRAFKAVKSFAPDVVVVQWWQPFFAPMVGTLARWFHRDGLSCLIECHNVFPHEGSPLDRSLLKFAFRHADAFITHSSKDRADLMEIVAGKRVGVAPLPVPSEFSGVAKHERNGRTILFFGKVRRYKGLDVLLAAMPKVLAQVDCHLLVVGEFYESIEKYEKLVSKYGLNQRVQIQNRYVPNEEVVEVFNGADVLVLPYLTASQSAVAHVALANALPVIASNCGGLPEVVTENVNGLLFPAGDDGALAHQIVSYFSQNLGPAFANNIRSAQSGDRVRLVELIENQVSEDPPLTYV